MGWQGALRSINAAVRRHEREARRRQRAAEGVLRQQLKLNAAIVAAAEVDRFEAEVEALTSIHRESIEPIDWEQLLVQPTPPEPPPPPAIDRSLSGEAKLALDASTRSFARRILNAGRKEALEAALQEALDFEESAEQRRELQHDKILAAHAQAIADLSDQRELSARVLAGDLDAQLAAVRGSGCMDELLADLGQSHVVVELEPTHATVTLQVEQDAVVPTETKSLTTTGRVSTKALGISRRTEIYEDYVCGAALRAAREILAAIPSPGALIHVETPRIDPATGHLVSSVILSVFVPRGLLSHIEWSHVDASELLSTLRHAMKLTRGKGFAPVTKIQQIE